MTHTEAAAKFNRCRDKDMGYKLANNTRLQKRGNAFAVRFHETDIVMIRPDGTYRLHTGGWRTVTTKNRINSILPCGRVSQSKSMWYIGDTMFSEGMLVDANGKEINGKKGLSFAAMRRAGSSVDFDCRQFINDAIAACMGHDIGTWRSHGKHKLPKITSKGHIANLWRAISDSGCKDMARWKNNPSLFFKWVYWSVLSRGYKDPRLGWDMIRGSCSRGKECFMVTDCMRSFIMKRKPMILDQIAFGELKVE